jgi:hypothetical protein
VQLLSGGRRQFGAGRSPSVSNSFIGPTSLTGYLYDALGRMTNRAINGAAQQAAFDMLNRVSIIMNVRGRIYQHVCRGGMLVSTNFYPNGQKTVLSHLGTGQDERLAD